MFFFCIEMLLWEYLLWGHSLTTSSKRMERGVADPLHFRIFGMEA